MIRWKMSTLVLGPLLLLSISLNCLQAKRILDFLSNPAAEGSSKSLVGHSAPGIRAKDMKGMDVNVLFPAGSSKPTVIYVFSPSCVWCLRNADDVNALIFQAKGRYEFVGLSLSSEGLAEFAKEHGIAFPIYAQVAPETISAYALEVTPQTIVVSADGKISASWRGAYVGQVLADVQKFFNVHLPA
jgi:peroxiredoxin